MLAKLYVQEIVKGNKTFKDVPRGLKEQVRQLLIDSDLEHLIIEDIPLVPLEPADKPLTPLEPSEPVEETEEPVVDHR